MVRNRKVFKKTVSIVNEKSTDMYESLVGDKKGFLLESYDKNYDRYTFFGMEPEEIVTSRGNALVITKADGTEKVREGNPLERLKEYYSEFHIEKEDEELSFFGGLVGNLGYDFVRYSEVLPDNNPDEIGIETIQMMLMTSFLMVDHVAETLMCTHDDFDLCCNSINRINHIGIFREIKFMRILRQIKALTHLYLRIWIDLQNTISHNLYLIFSDCLSRCYNLTVDVS